MMTPRENNEDGCQFSSLRTPAGADRSESLSNDEDFNIICRIL